ncbi:MAG: hypothetical protein COS95_01885 [Ignavibacteriales bacterium CG07_land_8_20_14_0_80_59_12]|nr:MAG: hypothetical protein COS95_01885 [Ignavibacteriales bacterium CG07_land_8_20_14_0_80_59_12]
MYKIHILILAILIPTLLFAQGNSDYTAAEMVKGCPDALRNVKYFSEPERFSYAVINSAKSDSLYFMTKRVNADSTSYLLIYTTHNLMGGYCYLIKESVDSVSQHLSGVIRKPDGTFLNVEITYPFNDNKISYKIPARREIIPHVDLELGIRQEMVCMLSNLHGENSVKTIMTESGVDPMYIPLEVLVGLAINSHLTLGFRFLEHYKIDFRCGYMSVYEDFMGLDGGIYLQADLFNTNFYGTAAIDYVINGGNSHGAWYYSESGGETTLLGLGFGCNASKHFNLDVMFYYPINKVYGYDLIPEWDDGPKRYSKIVNGIIKFGIQYSFIL